jgi:hypothetical protein
MLYQCGNWLMHIKSSSRGVASLVGYTPDGYITPDVADPQNVPLYTFTYTASMQSPECFAFDEKLQYAVDILSDGEAFYRLYWPNGTALQWVEHIEWMHMNIPIHGLVVKQCDLPEKDKEEIRSMINQYHSQ